LSVIIQSVFMPNVKAHSFKYKAFKLMKIRVKDFQLRTSN
jgi:hypothetical protein